MYTGTIVNFYGSWNSGLAHLLVTNHATGKVEVLLCENGPTGRALIALFNCLAADHTIDVARIRGQKILYSINDIGMLHSIGPIEQEV